jgi:hypothetical protein
MIANSSMYNEKQALRYQVETFKDTLDEHYETLNQAKRQVKEKSRVNKRKFLHRALKVEICLHILEQKYKPPAIF